MAERNGKKLAAGQLLLEFDRLFSYSVPVERQVYGDLD